MFFSYSTISLLTIKVENVILNMEVVMDTEKIGNYIKEKRKLKKLTQNELAIKLNITDRAVSKWERGNGCPDVSLLEDLSKILGVSIVEILNGEDLIDEPKNKHLINSINYSKENYILKIKNNINVILTTIILFVSLILIIFNIGNYNKLNKKYKVEEYSIIDKVNYDKYYNIIINNQGKYNNEEYKKIINYINDSKQIIDKLYNDYFDKEYYTMKDYYRFKDKYYNNIYMFNMLKQNNNSLYSILFRYNNSDKLFSNMIKYEKNLSISFNTFNSILKEIDDSYKYNISNKPFDVIQSKIISYINWYCRNDEQLFKDIIEVGELNEK